MKSSLRLMFLDPALVAQLEDAIKEEVTIVGELNEVASKQPYYKCVFPACLTMPCGW